MGRFGLEYGEIVFTGLNYVASPLELVTFSGECFMADLGIDMPLVYFKIMFALATPFVILTILITFYACLYQLKYLTYSTMTYYSWTSIFYTILLF